MKKAFLIPQQEKALQEKLKFGLHSLRAGGATTAANKGVCDRIF